MPGSCIRPPDPTCPPLPVHASLMRASRTKNENGEKVGALNKLFGFVYRGREKMKALKKSNRSLYYGIKYVTLGGLLTAFVVWA